MEVDAANDPQRRRKGRGFREPMDTDERAATGGAYDSLPTDRSTGPGPAKSVEGWVLFVTGIHEEAQEEDLHDAFAEYGDVKNIYMNLDRRTGYVKGYALVEFATKDEAQEAIDNLDGKEVLTQTIKVGWAFSTGPIKKGANRR